MVLDFLVRRGMDFLGESDYNIEILPSAYEQDFVFNPGQFAAFGGRPWAHGTQTEVPIPLPE